MDIRTWMADPEFLGSPASYHSETGIFVSYRQLIASRYPESAKILGIAESEKPFFKSYSELDRDEKDLVIVASVKACLKEELPQFIDLLDASDEEILSTDYVTSYVQASLLLNQAFLEPRKQSTNGVRNVHRGRMEKWR